MGRAKGRRSKCCSGLDGSITNFRKPWRYFVAQAGDLRFGVIRYDGRRRGAHQRRGGGVIRCRRQHYRQRFAGRCFAPAAWQRLRGYRHRRPDESRRCLYRHDVARRQPGDSRLQRRPPSSVSPAPPFQSRPAVGAGHRLGVKTAIGRIAEFLPHKGSERERRHCGEGPVVGHGANNGQPRAAVGAVDKG